VNRGLVGGELAALVGHGAFSGACVVHAFLLSAFVLIWHGGVPFGAAANVYDQGITAEYGLLAVLLPWTLARITAAERGDDLTAASALGGLVPSQLVVARALAAATAATVVQFCGAPALEVARRISGVPMTNAAADMARLTVFAAFVGTMHAGGLLVVSRVRAWIAGTAATVASAFLFAAGRSTALVVIAVGAAALVVLTGARWADRRRLYLRESPDSVRGGAIA
jgi:hypothetical protein